MRANVSPYPSVVAFVFASLLASVSVLADPPSAPRPEINDGFVSTVPDIDTLIGRDLEPETLQQAAAAVSGVARVLLFHSRMRFVTARA